jgi:hypothetical protein
MKKRLILLIILGTIFHYPIQPVFAKENLRQIISTESSLLKGNFETKITNWKNRASREITARINSMNQLITKIQSMKKLDDSNKSSLIGQVQSEIQTMQTLLQKIQADTDQVTIKTDLQSITKSFRIYLLFIPKIQILSTADQIDDIGDNMTTILTKLQLRGIPQLTLAEVTSKITDAKVHSQKARDLVLPLQSDNGVQSIFDSNKTILKQARDEIKAGNIDLKTAMEDFRKVSKELKKEVKTLTPILTITPTIKYGIFPKPSSTSREFEGQKKADLQQIVSGLQMYRTDQGKYPSTLKELLPKYLAVIPKDPQTNSDYNYQVDKTRLDYSLSANLNDGTTYTLNAPK